MPCRLAKSGRTFLVILVVPFWPYTICPLALVLWSPSSPFPGVATSPIILGGDGALFAEMSSPLLVPFYRAPLRTVRRLWDTEDLLLMIHELASAKLPIVPMFIVARILLGIGGKS